jgi:hypothetical protein
MYQIISKISISGLLIGFRPILGSNPDANKAGALKNRFCVLLIAIAFTIGLPGTSWAQVPETAESHDAFIKGLREVEAKDAVTASLPRTLSPIVSRFKGWFIDITERAKLEKLGDVEAVEGISLASEKRESSFWIFTETESGYLIQAAAGKYKGWFIARDDSAKPRPEGSNLTVAPALRLTNRQTGNSHWDLTMTEKGLVLTAKSGKFKGWYWDFGGNDPSHEESGRQVAVNVLLAEKIVAGSYFEVTAEK